MRVINFHIIMIIIIIIIVLKIWQENLIKMLNVCIFYK